MDILFTVHLVNALLMITIPVIVAIFLTRKFAMGWGLWWVGAAVFLLSQFGHVPFNSLMTFLLNRTGLVNLPPTGALLFNAIFLGLSAGLWEELFRYGMYRWWVREARSWRKGVLLGAGHGGAEAIALGCVALYAFIQMVALRSADLSRLVPASQLAQAVQQVRAYWSASWYGSLLGALERVFALTAQVALSVMVLQVFARHQAFWLWIAIFFHALMDASALLAEHYFGVYWTEGLIGLLALVSLAVIFALRSPAADRVGQTNQPVQPPVTAIPEASQETPEQLEQSRFQ
jgi:uncharacterized membrane protein YhfC